MIDGNLPTTPEEIEEAIGLLPTTEEEYMQMMAEQALKDQENLKKNPTEPMVTVEEKPKDRMGGIVPAEPEVDPCLQEFAQMVGYLESKYGRKMRMNVEIVFASPRPPQPVEKTKE